MDAKKEALEIITEINNIDFTNSVEFETGYSDVDIEMPNWVTEKIVCGIIDRMTFKENSIDKAYWNEVKSEIINTLKKG